MKRYIKHLIILAITIASVIPSAFAQVDVTRSFYVLRNDSTANAFVEGGEWLIEFSNRDTLGYEYDHPVAMNFKGAYYPDSTFIPMQAVDSVQFVQPSTIMKPGVFELTEEHYKYIIETDYKSTLRFRIDCIAKIDLPKVGQKVISYIYEDPLPLGFLGQVESIKVVYDEGSILLTYKPIRLSDVYDRLYVASVTGQNSESSDTVPEVVSQTSNLRPVDKYDPNDKINTIADIPLPLPDVGIVYNMERKALEWSSSPKTDYTPIKMYTVDNTLGVKVYEAIIIDSDNNEDYTETVVELSVESTLGAAIDLAEFAVNEHFTGKNPLEKRFSFAPKIKDAFFLDKDEKLNEAGGIASRFPNLPAAFWRVDWGLLLKVAFDGQLKVEDTFKLTTKIGYKDTGNLTPVLSVLWPDKLEFNNLNFDLGGALALQLKGGLYGMVKIGIPSVIDVSAEICGGFNVDGSINVNHTGLDKDEELDAKQSTLSVLEHQLKAINRDNYFKFQGGIMFDGKVSVLKGYLLNESWVDWLRKNETIKKILDFALVTFVEYEGYPSYEFYQQDLGTSTFAGFFRSKKRFMHDHRLGLLFKDRYLDAEDPSYVELRYLKEMTNGDPVNFPFTIHKDDNKSLKGKPLEVYSIIKENVGVSTGKMSSTGKIAEFEFPYESKVTQTIGDDYTYVAIDVEVDPDAAEDEDYTQSGVLVWKDGKKEESGIRLVGNENYAVNATMEFKRDMFSDYRQQVRSEMVYNVKPWVYDAKRDRYVYGEQSSFKMKPLVGPKTMPATDITYNSAYLNGSIHEEFFNYIEEDFELLFSYWIPGETAETVIKFDSKEYPNLATTFAFDTHVTGLRPNTEYEYRVGLNYSSDGFFGGDPVKFKTKNVISNLKHEAGTDFAILYADVITDFIADELKEVSFEIVESDKDFKNAIGKIADEGDFIINENGTTTIDVIFYGLKPSIKYKYRMVFETESGYKVYSDVGYLTTEATLLKAITGSSTVSGNTARIKGTLSDDLYELLKSQEVKNVYFNYMEKSSDMSIGVNVEFSGTSYSTKLTGLNYETTYVYQFYAEDLDGNKYEGEWMTFTTDKKPAGYAEECYTLSATVNDADVTMIGGIPASTLTAVENGTLKNVQYGFEVSESSSGLTGTKPTFATSEIDVETGLFTITKILQPNTTYYIRAMVFINDRWIVAPEVVSVKTADFDPNLKPPDVPKE